MRSIISLLDKKESISNEISRLQRTQQTISEQVKDYVKNLSPEKKRFLDDKILSTFDEKTIEHIEAYRKYIKDFSNPKINFNIYCETLKNFSHLLIQLYK